MYVLYKDVAKIMAHERRSVIKGDNLTKPNFSLRVASNVIRIKIRKAWCLLQFNIQQDQGDVLYDKSWRKIPSLLASYGFTL